MSRKLATTIKDSAIPGKYKRVLETYAAFANNDGTNIRPSQKQLGNKAGVCEDTVQRNTPDLVASTILQRATSHTCKVAACNKGAWHFTGTWGRSTLVYEIHIHNLQNAVEYLTAKCGLVNAAKCRKVKAANCGTTQALNITPALGSLALGINPDSCAEVPSSIKKQTKEPLASLAEAGQSQADTNQLSLENSLEIVSESKTKAKATPELVESDVNAEIHPSVFSLQRKWKERTGHLFTNDEKRIAHGLILAHRYRVVEAVLQNTLYVRPKSAKLRWNKFSIFAKHWQRNHEEYLAWCASGKTTQLPHRKFDPAPAEGWVDQNAEEFNGLVTWFRESGKVGEYTVNPVDLGLRKEHAYIAMKYLGDEGIAVDRETFVNLLMECAGVREYECACGNHCKGFCKLECEMEMAE
jgi:hypothetical protein